MAPDYEEPNQEVVESPLVFTTQTKRGASGSEPSADHMPRCRRKRTSEILVIDIAKPEYYIERPIGRWQDDSWPIK